MRIRRWIGSAGVALAIAGALVILPAGVASAHEEREIGPYTVEVGFGDEPTFAKCERGRRHIWTYDVRDPADPKVVARFPEPAEADYCAKGGFFGPHNLHENRPGAFRSEELIFATYNNAGLRVFDIRDAFAPKEIASWVPPVPKRLIDPRPAVAL